jgi:hypothetical protein
MPLNDSLHYAWFRLPIIGLHHKRGYHTFDYDPRHQRGIVFGGDTTNGTPTYENDVWALNLQLGQESWTNLNISGVLPILRANPGHIYNPVKNSIILFGGIDINGYHLDDIWELKLDSLLWRQINVTGLRPAKRQHFAFAYNQVNNRMIIFGGRGDNGAFYNDVWALDFTVGNEHWIQLNTTGNQPPGVCSQAYGYDSRNHKLYVFGGWNYYMGYYTFYNDRYVLDIPTMVWNRLNPSGEPPIERRDAAGVYDIFHNNLIIMGGDSYGQLYYDTYILNLGLQPSISELTQPSPIINPNIFINSPTTEVVRIHYILQKSTNIKLDIVDVNGRIIKSLYSGKPSSNSGWLLWDKRNNKDVKISAGIYFCRLQTDDISISKKFVVVK